MRPEQNKQINSNINTSNVAGVVVLYNSGDETLENIYSYINQISHLYVVDNSDVVNSSLVKYLQPIEKVTYICNNSNLGIAYALNLAARHAILNNYTYLLTMDDDSVAPEDMIQTMVNFLQHHSNPVSIGITSVAHSNCQYGLVYKKVNFTMTSGNLVNLVAYERAGGYNERLFIDQVDHEFNIRLNLIGYDIVELCNLKLDHKLGDIKSTNIFGLNVRFISHSPIRFYYMVRNTVFIVKKYFIHSTFICLTLIWLAIKEVVKSLLLDDNKLLRMKYLLLAVKAGIYNKLGKYNN